MFFSKLNDKNSRKNIFEYELISSNNERDFLEAYLNNKIVLNTAEQLGSIHLYKN